MPDLETVAPWLQASRRKIAILDSNLLIVLIAARSTQPISTFRHVKEYDATDINVLLWLVGQFKETVTNAYVLAETSNLANDLTGDRRAEWFNNLCNFIGETREAHIPTQDLRSLDETARFGVADAALSQLSDDYVLITADYRLGNYLHANGRQVVKFNDIRNARLLSDD